MSKFLLPSRCSFGIHLPCPVFKMKIQQEEQAPLSEADKAIIDYVVQEPKEYIKERFDEMIVHDKEPNDDN